MNIWSTDHGGYYHPACKQCGESFTGRKNRQFCTAMYKNAFNNERAAERKAKDQVYVGPILQNIRILGSVFRENGDGVSRVVVTEDYLKLLGFDSSGTFKRTSVEEMLWHETGPYRFRNRKDGSVEIELILDI